MNTLELVLILKNNNSLYQVDSSELNVDFGSTLDINQNDNLNQIIFNNSVTIRLVYIW